ncbi:uncharacterized protein LAESUDRAFT_107448 [Laetiporus sulphureus 93-53]|uniref:Dystroglycan-type cadherin-like domain-containing protein n=1 Tax=Laetiporus sulphureus 93-53 TaxID=1314785 RepID=A0A165EMF0_9APHY|nr:uncharacterized protein LAESUDRAFT_107448 [Laetiporus sulphureus 93-53]KZT07365.1 hypothetical protein LAESUDRAFT_107448 [Laetiporus sulphureus 93-53]
MGPLFLPTHPITMLVILLCLVLSAVRATASNVSVQFPLSDQLPLIARVNQSYSWSFLRDTFVSSQNSSLQYTTSTLPAWLSFDNSTLTFSGTPSSDDEGTPGVRVTATDPATSDSASSSMTLCVTSYAPPQLKIPVAQQFYATNPSLSSVFLLSQNSALNTSRPTLRIPPSWSFSIGFLADTFVSDGDVYYAGLRADGSPLPYWMVFNPDVLTFDGVTPLADNSSSPPTVSLSMYASDQEGYSAGSVSFDIVVADHELSMTTLSLPTINVTSGDAFNFTLTSPDDFAGVLLDGKPVQPSDIISLNIDTSRTNGWIKYDSGTRTLSGTAPNDSNDIDDGPVLPVTLTASIHQSIQTNVSVDFVPSYFTAATGQPLLVLPGQNVQFDLARYFSNSSDLGTGNGDVNLTAAFDPASASAYLSFDPSSSQLTGTIPSNVSASYSHITVTFTAYSHVTHSTSHISLPVSLSNSDYAHQQTGGGLSAAVLALMRRYARVPDTAVTGEEGTRAWTTEEMKWYGIGIEVDGRVTEGPKTEYDTTKEAAPTTNREGLGFSLQQVLSRTLSHPRSILSARSPQSPGFMRKGEFLGKIKSTARIVSDKYKRSLGKQRRPVISKPTLIMTSDHRVSAMTGVPVEGLPFTFGQSSLGPPMVPSAVPLPFEDMGLSHYGPSGLSSLADSPSSSTGERSIPRRRADFGPPKGAKELETPPQAHLAGKSNQRRSADSGASASSSLTSNSSSKTHEAEAIVQRAARATSVRSGMSVSSPRNSERGFDSGRPRLVPFTSSSRVPVPKLPSGAVTADPDAPIGGAVQTATGGARTKRVVSQVAKVFRNAAGIERKTVNDDVEKSPRQGHPASPYARSIGDELHSAASSARSPSGSFSVELSTHGQEIAYSPSGKIPIVPRMLARSGEQFKFRVPVSYSAGSPLNGTTQRKPKMLEARLMSGKPLPKFVKSDLNTVPGTSGARVEKRVVEFWGVPTARDTGELNIGIYERDGDKCVGRVIIQIVERS